MLGFERLNRSCPDISHFVTTRMGGYGEDAYATLNCTHYTGDNPADVSRNREIVCKALPRPPKELVIPCQVHGAEVRRLDASFSSLTDEDRDRMLSGVDALVTNVPGYCICVSTADCVPILLYDMHRKAVAAVHAGWRGTVQRILKKTLKVMADAYGTDSRDVLAGIGPSISAASFEVGEEVWQAFAGAGFDMSRISFRSRETGKWHIDLWEANRVQMLESGVDAGNIEVAEICTYRNYGQFFSARRLGLKSGRILSGIMLIE